MDMMGIFYLAIAIVAVVIIDLGILELTKRPPKGAALVFAMALAYIPSILIPENDMRELHLLEGTLKFAGTIGILIGIFGLFRKMPTEETQLKSDE